ncbi:iron chelate uptake ABC transporter family permease subunit [Brachybacterium alimentarium]|uniref:iron chelate uptake ABC transporter family permease subunit n=1 Tax=Brachybacterium alimentarium TaxID=47845 RepID=UPI003FD3CB31
MAITTGAAGHAPSSADGTTSTSADAAGSRPLGDVGGPSPRGARGPDGSRGPDALGVRSRSRRSAAIVALLTVSAVVSLMLCMGLGPVSIPAGTTIQVISQHLGLPFASSASVDASTDAIIWTVRLPRVLMGAAVGACLAISGTALQAMVRNMLADPYILGVSGGASTGAAAAILFGVGAAMGEYAQSVLAFVGALGAALLVFAIARAGGRVTSLRLLLSGVAVGYALTAVTNLLIFSSDSAEGSRSVMFWMLGSLSLARWNAFLLIAVCAAAIGVAVMTLGARVLDALSAGDEIAHGLGISPDRARIGFLLAVSLCTAAAVAGAGAIGFVGLVIPHLARRLVGARHRVLIPASALLGSLFLLWADAFARVAMQPRELPIGVITAAIGAPFLLILVRRLHARRP